MTTTLTLKVEDDFFKLVQKWKPYINIAKEVERSLRLLIKEKDSYSNRLKEASNMGLSIEKLRQEKKYPITGDPERARKDGLKWAQNATYNELEFVRDFWQEEINETLQKGGLVDMSGMSWIYEEILCDYFENKIFPFNHNMEWETAEFNKYIPEWLIGVNDFWDIVKTKI